MSKPLIALGVTGGIAAYKAADLTSKLVKEGYQVQVIMTKNATKFVTELTFRTLSQRMVITDLWECENWRPKHVALSQEAELFAVVPATANFLGKYAHGIADDALTTFAATFNGKVLLAPAMNPEMWRHISCVENVALLKKRGVTFVGPDCGHVACGAEGVGRLTSVEQILNEINNIIG